MFKSIKNDAVITSNLNNASSLRNVIVLSVQSLCGYRRTSERIAAVQSLRRTNDVTVLHAKWFQSCTCCMHQYIGVISLELYNMRQKAQL